MIVRTLDDVLGTSAEIDTPNWTSRRLLLRGDRMGFSLHDTIIRAGTETEMCYLHHLEAVYCIEGDGEIETLDDGRVHPIRPGTMYALDGHERHRVRATSALRLICVFTPPLAGTEVHGEDGAYPLLPE